MTAGLRLALTGAARNDLAAAKAWLTQPGAGRRSHARYIAILKALQDLPQHPDRWPVSEHPGLRRRSAEGRVILYRVDAAARRVTVLRIFGPYQDQTRL